MKKRDILIELLTDAIIVAIVSIVTCMLMQCVNS